MTIYRKLQTARAELSKSNIKKSGFNSFGGWKYYELGDFIPTVHKIFDAVGLCGVFTFGETATLTIFDTDGDGSIQFSTPVVFAESNKGQPIQLLGSTHTYLRRYLWLMAMELTESDSVDAEKQEEKPEPIKVTPKTPPKRMEGAEGPWQLTVKTQPNASTEDWAAVTLQATRLGLEQASSEEDVMKIFKVNKGIFDRLKADSPKDYDAILENFKKRKAELKELNDGAVS
jgi:hypothetical protein